MDRRKLFDDDDEDEEQTNQNIENFGQNYQ